MISISMNLTTKTKLFLLKLTVKDYLWSGSRLNDYFVEGIPLSLSWETLECSTYQDVLSTLSNGIFAWQLLTNVLRAHSTILRTHPRTEGELTILIKFVDVFRTYLFKYIRIMLIHTTTKMIS